MAESFAVTKQAILAVSNQRWILFEQSAISGAPKSVSAECTHDAIRASKPERLAERQSIAAGNRIGRSASGQMPPRTAPAVDDPNRTS